MVQGRNKSSRRVMYALFFECDGIVARVPVPEKSSVTGTFYKERVLSAVVDHYITKRPRIGVRGLHILHDNGPDHRSAVVIEYLEEMKIKTLPHPAYSPALSPCDFWLNPYIKSCLRGCRFESRAALESALFQCINSIPKDHFTNAFSVWIRWLEKCVLVKGEYFEGLD